MLRVTLVFVLLLSLGSATAANRLAKSQSPYLLQHADNPVNWYPWGEEAFARARSEEKLTFLSIGYSTCHWCHVMNRESFSDEEIAEYLNDNYICIKVDREERADIDATFLAFVKNLRGHAGWPLNVFLTPDQKPFYGGTYYPARNDPDKGPGFLELIQEIQKSWHTDPSDLISRSQQIIDILAEAIDTNANSTTAALSLQPLGEAVTRFLFTYDENGKGFGKGEKFPSPTTLTALLRASVTEELHPEDRELARRMALEALDAVVLGSLHDHIGGGFHRYTVDPNWELPHFEKMLYDQALMVQALLDAWQLTGRPQYRQAATKTLDYLLERMRHPTGAFFSAEDAESTDPQNPDTKREGAYYLWNWDQLTQALPDSAQRKQLLKIYNVSVDGNAPQGAFPTEQFANYNALRLSRYPSEEENELLLEANQLLKSARQKRPRPHLDDKIITGWNGLAISALSRAGAVLERPEYTYAAKKAARFIFTELYDEKSNRLARLYRKDASEVAGFAEDYAYLVRACLDLYTATADHQWLIRAKDLQIAMDNRFLDTKDGGYFLFEETENLTFARHKLPSDAAMPSATAVSIENLVLLAQYFGEPNFLDQAKAAALEFYSTLGDIGTQHPEYLQALTTVTVKPLQVVVAGSPHQDDTRQMLAILHQRLVPNAVILYADQSTGQSFLEEQLDFLRSAKPFDGKATVYFCENFVCQMPTNQVTQFARLLDDHH